MTTYLRPGSTGIVAWCRLCNRRALYVDTTHRLRGNANIGDGEILEIVPTRAGGGLVETEDGLWVRNTDPEVLGHWKHRCRIPLTAEEQCGWRWQPATSRSVRACKEGGHECKRRRGHPGGRHVCACGAQHESGGS